MIFYDIIPPEKIKKFAKEEILGIKKYKDKNKKYFAFGWRVVLLFFTILYFFGGITPFALFKKTIQAISGEEKKAVLFSSSCSGEWETPQKAQGYPEVGSSGNIDLFSADNSAVYNTGNLIIICHSFSTSVEPVVEKVDLMPAEEVTSTEADITGAATPQKNNTENSDGSTSASQAPVDRSIEEKEPLKNDSNQTSFLGKIKQFLIQKVSAAEGSFSAKIKISFAIGEKENLQTEEAIISTVTSTPEPENISTSSSEVDNANIITPEPESVATSTPKIEEIVIPNAEPENISTSSPEVENANIIIPEPESVATSTPEVESVGTSTEEMGFWKKFKNFFNVLTAQAEENENATNSETVTSLVNPETAGEAVEIIEMPIISGGEKNVPESMVTSSEDQAITATGTEIISEKEEKIIVWASLDGELWRQLGTILYRPLSNASNNGYLEYDVNFLKNWEDVKNLKIKFEGAASDKAIYTAYLDSVWVEVKYYKSNTEKEENKEVKNSEEGEDLLEEEIKPEIQATIVDLKTRKLEKEINLYKKSPYGCTVEPFQVYISANIIQSAKVILQERGKNNLLEIGNLPTGIDVHFVENGGYLLSMGLKNETVIEVYSQTGSQKGSFSIPIIYYPEGEEMPATICQINIINR